MKDKYNFLFKNLCVDRKKIRLIELFGGVGCQAKAFEILEEQYPSKVEFEHYKLIEFDKYCVQSYNLLHNTNFIPSDITKINYNDLEIKNDDYIYIVTYSFPCQDLSTAGLQKGMGEGSNTRSSLLWEVKRLLFEGKEYIKNNPNYKMPEILVMENVSAIENKLNIRNFNLWRKILEDLGYKNYTEQLNSNEFGIPQSRLRTIMVSIKDTINGKYYFPIPFKLKRDLYYFIEKNPDKKFFISQKMIDCLTKIHPKFNRRQRLLSSLKHINTMKEANTILTTSGSRPTDNFIYYPTFFGGKVEPKLPIKEGEIRRLSTLENWRLMGWQDKDFEKIKNVLSTRQLIKQAGNGIVITVLVATFAQLFSNIDVEKTISEYIEKIKNEY